MSRHDEAIRTAIEVANDWQPHDPELPWPSWLTATAHAVELGEGETVVVAIRDHDWRDAPGAEVCVIEVRDGWEVNVEPFALDLPTLRALHDAIGAYLAKRQ